MWESINGDCSDVDDNHSPHAGLITWQSMNKLSSEVEIPSSLVLQRLRLPKDWDSALDQYSILKTSKIQRETKFDDKKEENKVSFDSYLTKYE